MATRSISLTDPQAQFVEDQVRSGDYPNANEVVRTALDLLKSRAERRARKLERLNAAIQEGLDDMDAGRFEVVEDIGGWLGDRGRGKPAR
jgi:antitoxin ParD1/3/4